MLSYFFCVCSFLGFVIRNASFAHLQNCLVTKALYFFSVPAPVLLFWAISLCTISVFIPIENSHMNIVHFGKHCGCTLNPSVTSVLCSNILCVSEPSPSGFPYFPDASDLSQRRDDAKWYLDYASENYVEYTLSVCYLPRLSKSKLLVFRGTQPVHQLSEQLALNRTGPDDVSESQ